VFFRSVEVDGAGRLPATGPVVVVGNHTNGLVDGLLLIGRLDRYPRFLGKATLWRILPLRPLLRLAGVVPVYRAADGGGTAGNDRTFERCRQMLGQGGVIAIFPEGISHDEASLQPLRTGAARIALGAAFDDDVEQVVVVPVGLVYDAKARFRSRALVNVGEPMSVDSVGDEYAADPHGAVRRLTDAIATALRAVGPDYETVAQAEMLARIANVAAAQSGSGAPAHVTLAERDQLARAMARTERERGAVDEDWADLVAAQSRYERDLSGLGVTDADIATRMTPLHYRRALAWAVVKTVLTAPIALVGAIVHVVPYQIMKQVARVPRNEGMKSTVKLLGCTALFVLEWVVLGVTAGILAGPLTGLAVLVACPTAGYVTVRFAEGVRDAGGLVHGWRRLRSNGASLTSVRADRDQVVSLARSLGVR
jgi:glycerol-3-phosphate O-acyltransferase / dihydroxyacetone phosphate acyltransferase